MTSKARQVAKRRKIRTRTVLLTNGRCASQDPAGSLRRRFADWGTFALNLVSAPGSGKTELVARTAQMLKGELRIAAVAGDVKTDLDAARIAKAGIPAIAIETGGSCHISAERLEEAVRKLKEPPELLFIENVGNLVCPSVFDLGEDAKVALVSLPEGDDKPQKYPAAFAHAAAFVITKIDLAGVCNSDRERMKRDAKALNPDIQIFELSAITGAGMDAWCEWLKGAVRRKRKETIRDAR